MACPQSTSKSRMKNDDKWRGGGNSTGEFSPPYKNRVRGVCGGGKVSALSVAATALDVFHCVETFSSESSTCTHTHTSSQLHFLLSLIYQTHSLFFSDFCSTFLSVFLSVSQASFLGLIHTRHFDAQYCDKKIFLRHRLLLAKVSS